MILKRGLPKPARPPRAMLCHCRKCEARWTVRMQLVNHPNNETRIQLGLRPKQVWMFMPEEFEHCENCGANSSRLTPIIKNRIAMTDDKGNIKLTFIKRIEE